jgi:hypothetical protein
MAEPPGRARSEGAGAYGLPLFVRRFLADYTRNPVNLLMLVLVPTVFVVVVAGSLGDAAKLLGGPGGPAVQTAAAGWAAGFLAAIAMYFQVRSARAADRRLVLAGLRPARLVTARLVGGLVLALLATATALVALLLRAGIDNPDRTIAGTLMFAVIYLAIGAVVGALVASPVNGMVLILFVWIVDVFFGPAMGAADRLATRALPTHFLTLWMVDLPSGHSGRLGDLGVALVWLAAALVAAFAVVTATSRPAHRPHARRRPGSLTDQLTAGLRMGLRDYRRTPVLWALLVVVPAVFVLLSYAATPNRPISLAVTEAGRRTLRTFPMPEVHGATMGPIAVASLAALAGLFMVLDARSADQRLALAGLRVPALLASRLAVVGLAALVATTVSLAATATVTNPRQWGVYAAANLLVAASYGLIGVIIGPLVDRVTGVFIAFLAPFLDLGIGQSPMLRDHPAAWAHALPGYGPEQIMIGGAFTPTFDETVPLLISLVWLVGLVAAAAVVFRHAMATPRRPVRGGARLDGGGISHPGQR